MAEKSLKYVKLSEEDMEVDSGDSDSSDGEETSEEESMDVDNSEDETTGTDDEKMFPVTTIRQIDKSIKDLGSEEVPKLNIKKRHDKTDEDEEAQPYKDNKDPDPKEVCERIIKRYNDKIDKDEKAQTYILVSSDKVSSILILVYRQEEKKELELDKHWYHNMQKISTVNYIMFLITEKGSIYCLTYGTAHHVIKGFEDSQFSNKAAKYGTSKNVRKVDARRPRGIYYAISQFFRSPSIPHYLQVNGMVTSFQSRVEGDILEHNDALQLTTEVGARIEVSRTGVRILKELKVNDMCKLIKELDDNMDNKGGGCDILDYIAEVKDEKIIDDLEMKMFDRILEDMNTSKDDPPPFDFMYKVYEEHMKGSNFSFSLIRKGKKEVEYDELESYYDAVAKLKEFLKVRLIDFNTYFCNSEGKDKNCKFLEFLHGSVEYEGNMYQKEGVKWTMAGNESQVKDKILLTSLNETVIDYVLKDMAEVNRKSQRESFQFYYQNEDEHQMQRQFSFGKKDTKCNMLSTYSDALRKLKLFLSKNLKISFKTEKKKYKDLTLNFFHGEIIYDDQRGKNESFIYYKIDGKWYRYDQQFSESLEDAFISLIKGKFKDGTRDNIHLNEVWPINDMNDKKLAEKCYNRLYCEIDCFYVGDTILPYNVELFDIMKVLDNELYLYHVKDGFGCITRDACSQIRNSALAISESRRGGGKNNFLRKYYELVTNYDGDIKFRETERDKLKKISFNDFLKWFQEKQILFVYAFTHATESKKEQKGTKSTEKELKGTKSTEKELKGTKSTEKELKGTKSTEKKLKGTKSTEKKLKGTKSTEKKLKGTKITEKKLKDYLEEEDLKKFSTSHIARHELYHTNLFLEELGFQFAICQINRSETENIKPKIKAEEEQGESHSM